MSNEERQRRNLPRFSWEFTVGDAIQLLVVVALAVKMYDQVQDHQTRLDKVDKTLEAHTGRLSDLDQRVAIYQDRQDRGRE